MYEFLIILGLLLLVGFSFYAGHEWTLPRVVEDTIHALEEEKIIRFVEKNDGSGEVEIYSGTKFYNGGVK